MFPEITRDDVFRLETGRLWLRWPRAADAGAIAAAAGRREVAEMTAAIPHPYPAGAAEQFVLAARKANAAGESLTLVASLSRGRRDVIGAVSVVPTGRKGLEVGYWIAPERWGEGYATEAVRALVDGVFTVTDCETIEAGARTVNGASHRVLQKCGFAWQGSGIREFPARGGAFPVEHFSLDRRMWLSLKGWEDARLVRRETTVTMDACCHA